MFQSVRRKALAMLHNYFVFKTNAAGEKYVSINNGDELLSYIKSFCRKAFLASSWQERGLKLGWIPADMR